MKKKYLIIGAGPAGLGAALRLKELGVSDFLVLERENYVGGLSTSFVDREGFTWDVGGHVQFSHYEYFDQLMLRALGADGWLKHERESWIWLEKRFVPYPFQNNIKYLPRDSMWKCLSGLIQLHQGPNGHTPQNFREWLMGTFGRGIAETFLFPYNFKVWAYPLEQLSWKWVGERVAVVDLERVTENILYGRDDLSWGPNATFQFPLRGGTGAIWKQVGRLVGPRYIRLNADVREVDAGRKQVVLSDGTRLEYETLLNTSPLDLFCGALRGMPSELQAAARNLKHSATHVVGLGLKGAPKPELKAKCWMYFPEQHSPYYRITLFSNYSPNNVPDSSRHWSLMTETSESPFKPVDRTALAEDTVRALLEDGLIESREQIVSVFQHRVEYGYPTPCLERDSILETVLPALESRHVYSRGRFGAWRYEVANQDHSLMQGVEWANRMIFNAPEVTAFFPAVANAMWGKRSVAAAA